MPEDPQEDQRLEADRQVDPLLKVGQQAGLRQEDLLLADQSARRPAS